MYNGRAIDSPVAISADARAILTKLQIADDVADGLVEHIVESEGLASFDDFRCQFRIAELVAKAKMPVGHTAIDEPGFHGARLRQVWEAITSQHKVQQDIRAKGAEGIKLDELMDVSDISDLRDSFWNRYRVAYPADITPGDALVSRKKKELDNFLLTTGNPLKARSLNFDRNTDPKRKEVAEGLTYTPSGGEIEVTRQGTISNWLDGLCLELLALTIAGSTKLEPQPTEPEKRGTDPTAYIMVPWCTALRYHWRATEASSRVSSNHRYAWLKQRCHEERTIWMECFRESRRPLGRIIAEVYKARENVWWNQSVSIEGASIPGISSLPSQVSSLQQEDGNRGEGNNVVVYITGGWKKLCKAFQSGKCRTKGKRCDAGLHKCGGVLPGSNTKVCGLTNHGGHKCGRCRRA